MHAFFRSVKFILSHTFSDVFWLMTEGGFCHLSSSHPSSPDAGGTPTTPVGPLCRPEPANGSNVSPPWLRKGGSRRFSTVDLLLYYIIFLLC